MAKVYISKIDTNYEDAVQSALKFLYWESIIPRGVKVFIKPNLTYPTYSPGVTTSPEFIEAVIKVISSRTDKIIVGESDGGYRGWPADMAFKGHNLLDICKKYGVRLINLSTQPCTSFSLNLSKGKINLKLPTLLMAEIDVFITLPVPKIHQVTTFSGAIKNQWGCIPDSMRLLNHPYFDELILEINRLLKVRLALADGKYFLNKTGPMLGGIPVFKNLIIGSNSIGALDAVLCQIMGINYNNIRYLRFASKNGWIPPEENTKINISPDIYYDQKFYLKRSLRSRFVCWAFDRPWAVKMIWDSLLGAYIHRLLYLIAGNPVKDIVKEMENIKGM